MSAKVSDYKSFTDKEHILQNPDMYIGSIANSKSDELIYTDEKLINKTIVLNQGCEKLFLEILCNASDNVIKTRKNGLNYGKISVSIDENTISITNNGIMMPLEKNEEGIYIPELVFGHFKTSSNYTDNRIGGGKNGYGAKLTNVYSKLFSVEIYNLDTNTLYKQKWENNMSKVSKPSLTIPSKPKKESYCKITFTVDFEKFGLECYSQDVIDLYIKHVICVGFTVRVPVKINDKTFKISDMKKFMNLLNWESINTPVIRSSDTALDQGGLEFAILDTPYKGTCLSFVNGIQTQESGVHVNKVLEIFSPFLNKLNEKNKAKGIKSLNLKEVLPHVSLIVNAMVYNPFFESQSKRKLNKCEGLEDINFTDIKQNQFDKWGFVTALDDLSNKLNDKVLSKSDGKNTKNINNTKIDDANWAGKAKRDKTILIITEGESGAGYAKIMIQHSQHGRDVYGLFPAKGKVLNVRNASPDTIANNKEICAIKEALGLKHGVSYDNPEDIKKLRYGKFMIMADADNDGKHIIGLILNFFHYFHPGLITNGYITYWKTPIIVATKGDKVKKFYNYQDYENWDNTGYKVKYYKGLGSSKNNEVKDDMKIPLITEFNLDDIAEKSIKLAFDNKLSNDRKLWIATYPQDIPLKHSKVQDISDFINTSVLEYSFSTLKRAIPSLMDGFKESQRKTIYAAHKNWNIKLGKSDYNEQKVAQFAGDIAKITNYHHGEVILGKVIIGLACNFVGSNNIPYFTRDGQFGTRHNGIKDAGAIRYIYTRPEKILPYILRKEDEPILEYLEDEGEKIEPKIYYPIIPMVLINGTSGIATGYSTLIPNHNPLDLVNWIRCKIRNDDLPKIKPWYNGFNGEIGKTKSIIPNLPDEEDEEEGKEEYKDKKEEVDEEQSVNTKKLTYYSKGCFTINGNKVHITEIPVNRSPLNYENWLKKLRQDKKITDFESQSVANRVDFTVHGFNNPSETSLMLVKNIGGTNMYLLDNNDKPKCYNTSSDILEYFYEQRLPIYQKRKDYMLNDMTNTIDELSKRRLFITKVVNEELVVFKRKKDDIYKDMGDLPKSLLSEVKTSEYTYEELKKIDNEIDRLQHEIDILRKTNIKDIWLKELDEFEECYNKQLIIWNNEKNSSKK
jgi:DNA topoisomerase-2